MLKGMGQNGKALEVMADLAQAQSRQRQVLGALWQGAGCRRDGQGSGRRSRRIAAAGKADWKIYSALGSALDQQGQHAEARRPIRRRCSRSRRRSPSTTISACRLRSRAISRKPKARCAGRRRCRRPPASRACARTSRSWSGLQGRFDEAREIASKDLPPEQIEANMAYLKSMLAQPNTWQQLKPQTGSRAAGKLTPIELPSRPHLRRISSAQQAASGAAIRHRLPR